MLLALGYSVAALLCHWLSFGRPFARFAEGCRGIVPPYLVSPSALFALMAAFLGSAVVGMARQAEQAVLREHNGAIAIIEIARIVPTARDLRGAAETYIRAVLSHEWRQSRDFAPGEAALRALNAAVLNLPANPTIPAGLQARLLRDAREIGAARSTRRGIIESHVDEIPWLSVLLLGLLSQIGIALVHLDKRGPQAVAQGVTTVSIVVALGLIALIERPFDGIHTVSPAPLERILAEGGS